MFHTIIARFVVALERIGSAMAKVRVVIRRRHVDGTVTTAVTTTQFALRTGNTAAAGRIPEATAWTTATTHQAFERVLRLHWLSMSFAAPAPLE